MKLGEKLYKKLLLYLPSVNLNINKIKNYSIIALLMTTIIIITFNLKLNLIIVLCCFIDSIFMTYFSNKIIKIKNYNITILLITLTIIITSLLSLNLYRNIVSSSLILIIVLIQTKKISSLYYVMIFMLLNCFLDILLFLGFGINEKGFIITYCIKLFAIITIDSSKNMLFKIKSLNIAIKGLFLIFMFLMLTVGLVVVKEVL